MIADGVPTDKTLTLTKANNWTGSFTNLDEYKAGKKIVYTIKEEPVENGEIIEGESNITALDLEDEKSSRINRVFISPKFAKPLNEVVHEIYNSDVILIGPGSL